MSWHYSRALVAAFLAENSLDGQQYALSSGTPTPLLYCAPDRMTAFSRLSRFGMTFAPLMADLGADVLTWFLADSPARILAQPERAQELTEREAECGHTWPESLARYDPASRSWKTAQCSLLEGLDEFSETWPRWGMMRDGECWALSMPAHLISETGSGLLPTPLASNTKATHMQSGGRPARSYWPTPLATDGSKGGPNQKGSKGDLRLSSAVQMWPTPTASDGSKWNNMTEAERKAKGQFVRLGNALSTSENRVGGSLNPTWVEWLMGFPLEWTDCAASVTRKFRQWCGSHGRL